MMPVYGATISPLKAYCCKIRCPLKKNTFLWKIVSGCIAVKKKYKREGFKVIYNAQEVEQPRNHMCN